jgi:hypothetical protein
MSGPLRIYVPPLGNAAAVEVTIDEEELAAADANSAAAETIFSAIGDFTVRAVEAGHSEDAIADAIERFELDLRGRPLRPPPK